MNIEHLLKQLQAGKAINVGTEEYTLMVEYSNEAMRITSDLNSVYRTPEEIRKIMAELIGKPVDETFALFPPFYTDFGKNIHIGKNVFINACCCFQDQGGIIIGDGVLIGHKVVLASINHGLLPEQRSTCFPKPIRIENNVWIGANATILPGVTLGENAIIAAGAVVTKDVLPWTVVAGVPARFVKHVNRDNADKTYPKANKKNTENTDKHE